MIIVMTVGVGEDSGTEKNDVEYRRHYSDQVWINLIIPDFEYLKFETTEKVELYENP